MSRDLLEHAEQFRQTFREHPDSCRLRIAADCCFPENDALSKTIHAFSDQHDRTFRLLYRELAGHEVIRELDAGHADIGFIVYPESQTEKVQELLALRNLEEQILFHSSLQLFCRNAHPVLKDPNALTPELFDQYSFVLHSAEAASQISAESSILNGIQSLIRQDQLSGITYVNSRASFTASSSRRILSGSALLRFMTVKIPLRSPRFRFRSGCGPRAGTIVSLLLPASSAIVYASPGSPDVPC